MRSASPSTEQARRQSAMGASYPAGGTRPFCTCSAPQPRLSSPPPGLLATRSSSAPPILAAMASICGAPTPKAQSTQSGPRSLVAASLVSCAYASHSMV